MRERKSLDLIACPSCGRAEVDVIKVANEAQEALEEKGFPIQVAVMGCVVNGPGESKHADIGISLPGRGENPNAPVYIDGEKKYTLKGENIGQQFKDILGKYISDKYKVI